MTYTDKDILWGLAFVNFKRRRMSEVNAVETVKVAVVTELVTKHSFLMDDAATKVEEYYAEDPSVWGENSDAAQLANAIVEELDD